MRIPLVIEMTVGIGAEHQNLSKLFQNLIKCPIDVNILAINLYFVYQGFNG